MACMCGDTRCWSCGPAQGNNQCEACGMWDDQGGCENPEICQKVLEKRAAAEAEEYALECAREKEMEGN